MGIKTFTLCVGLFYFTALPVHASVSVTEIAWMGTAVSTADEWIEVYNDGDSVVDLSSYTLEWKDIVVQLEGSIDPSSFYILERTNDDSQPNVVADLIYSGALGNAGEHLRLLNAGVQEWSVNATEGWPAGDNTTKETMQWNGSTWVTAPPTPGAVAVGTELQESEESTTQAGVIYNAPVPYVEPTYSVTLQGPEYVAAGSRAQFRASGIPEHEKFEHVWSFGDAAVNRGRVVWHTYLYAGTYAPRIRAWKGDREYVSQAKVLVFEPRLSITRNTPERISLKNESTYPIDLYGWRMIVEGKEFIFERDTVVLPDSEASFPASVTGLTATGTRSVVIYRSDGKEVQRSEVEHSPNLEEFEKVLQSAAADVARLSESVKAKEKKVVIPKRVEVKSKPQEVATTTIAKPRTFVVPKPRSERLIDRISRWFDNIFRK